jgi:hypothetical protein
MTAGTRNSRRDRLIDEVEEITDVVGLNDLTNAELELLAALLSPAHTRYLDEGAGHMTPVLRLVQDD